MFRNVFAVIFLCLFCFKTGPALADQLDLRTFSKIPVMHEGRLKPMDSFARSVRKQLSGTDENAILWLTETLLNPALAENHLVLKISNPDLLNMLEIEKRKSKLFSYKEISKALAKKQNILGTILETPEDEWTPAQRDFVLLQKNTVLLGDILSSMTLFLPLSIQLPNNVPASLQPYMNKTLSYLDIMESEDVLLDEVRNIIKIKGEDLESYTESERAIVYLSFTLTNLQNAGQRSKVLRILPLQDTNQWISPWEIVLNQNTKQQNSEMLNHLKSLVLAFHNGNGSAWENSITNIQQEIVSGSYEDIRIRALESEHLYNQINPFYISFLLYCCSFLLLATCMYFKKEQLAGFVLPILWAGVFIHFSGIVARIYILERPPVSTLYESIIFVGFIAVLYGLISFMREKGIFWLFVSAGSGLFLHLLGFSYDQDGDNLMMLTAVLNTNFWLATHVICITMGYAFCIITSILAHYALIIAVFKKYNDAIFKHIHHVALLALLFSAVGTVLGGIWADQSWGRFWGWDPKENGALLIVLWLIWILHGRISGQMRKPMVIAGLAYLSVIVALSWFGVNLLSVGLHAYGFTDSAAWSLGIFVGIETTLIGTLLSLTSKRAKLS